MAEDFKVTVMGERAAEFRAVFGTETVCVTSPVPQWARLGDNAEPELVYMLDLDLLTAAQFDALVEHLCRKFGAGARDVRGVVRALGMPVRAAETITTIENPQRWLD